MPQVMNSACGNFTIFRESQIVVQLRLDVRRLSVLQDIKRQRRELGELRLREKA